MIYKFILKLIICLIGVSLFNLTTYFFLSISYADDVGSWPNIVSVFFRDLLFRNEFYQFYYSISLSILVFVCYFLYEYLIDQKKIHEKKLKESIENDLIVFGAGIFIWSVVLMLIGFGLIVSNVLFLFFLGIPYFRGWKVLFNEVYFKYPTVYFYIFSEHDGISEFISGLITCAIFLLLLFISFARESRVTKIKLKADSPAANTAYKYPFRIRIIYFLYLIYMAPTIFVWLYPIVLSWLNKLSFDSLAIARIRFSYKVLSYLFASGFILTIYKIIKHNRKVMIADMKEEIKNEIMNEKNNPL